MIGLELDSGHLSSTFEYQPEKTVATSALHLLYHSLTVGHRLLANLNYEYRLLCVLCYLGVSRLAMPPLYAKHKFFLDRFRIEHYTDFAQFEVEEETEEH